MARPAGSMSLRQAALKSDARSICWCRCGLPTSTRLGLEDWPSKARPTEIEQVSEALQLAYPTDPQTGRLLPARLRIKLVAPDFRVDGQADRLIEVPPDAVLEATGVPADAVASRFLSHQCRSLWPRRPVSRSRPGRDRGGRWRGLRTGDLRRQPGARSGGSPGGGASAGRTHRGCVIAGFTRGGRCRVGRDHNAQFLSADSGERGSISTCGRSRGVRAHRQIRRPMARADSSRRSRRAVPQEAVVACGAGDSTACRCRVRGRCVAHDSWRA